MSDIKNLKFKIENSPVVEKQRAEGERQKPKVPRTNSHFVRIIRGEHHRYNRQTSNTCSVLKIRRIFQYSGSGAGVGGILQKGLSLYLAFIITTILLSISLGLSTILIGQIKITQEIGYSVIAFYAADAGIEEILLSRDSPADIAETFLANGATYRVAVTGSGVGVCTAANYCIKSIGTYQETRRAIEITY